MSASREKKQRQDTGASEKNVQAQKQQSAQKRKTITYTIIGVVVAVLVAALLIWNSGFFQARATAATVGDTELSAAELSYHYYTARQSVAMYGSYLGFDVSTPDEEQAYPGEEGKTYRDYFMETALDNARWTITLAEQALADGHTEDEVKDDLAAQIASVKSSAASSGYSYSAYLQAMYGPYMSKGVFENCVRQILLANLAYGDKSTELSESYSQDDLTAYYNEEDHADTLDTIEYSYLYFTPATVETKDEDGNDIDEETVNQQKEEALADAKETAEEALESLRDGETVASLISKYELDGSSGDHLSVVGTGAISSVYQETLLSLEEEESALVENGESGYYVVTFHGRKLVEDPTRDVRHVLINAETTTDEEGNTVEPTQEAWDAAKEKIDAIVAEFESGDKSEDSFAKLANENSDDPGSNTNGGLYEGISQGDFVAEFDEWMFDSARKAGDTGLVQHSADENDANKYWGYHFIYLVGDGEPVWMRTVRSTLTQEATNAWVEELEANYETALTDGAENVGR